MTDEAYAGQTCSANNPTTTLHGVDRAVPGLKQELFKSFRFPAEGRINSASPTPRPIKGIKEERETEMEQTSGRQFRYRRAGRKFESKEKQTDQKRN